jgi:hypothetical protein
VSDCGLTRGQFVWCPHLGLCSVRVPGKSERMGYGNWKRRGLI